MTLRQRSHLSPSIADALMALGLLLVILLCLYPFWYIIIRSFNDSNDLAMGGVFLWPRVFSLESYRIVFKIGLINPFFISCARVAAGVVSSVFISAMLAFVLSHKDLIGRKFFSTFFISTMYFSAGLIPNYLLIMSLRLMNTFWVYILPGLVGVYNMILLRVYFEGLPISLEESATLDGASELRVFLQIILPLSLPIIAAVSIFVGVGQWNSWQDAYLYNTNQESLWPLQLVLMNILNESTAIKIKTAADVAAGTKVKISSQSIQLAITAVTTIPIIIIYPFFQKYFISGVMLGAVKE